MLGSCNAASLCIDSQLVLVMLQLGVDGWKWRCRWRWRCWWQGEYSLLMLPASALMLFRPTVAPARPCRVPREVREFMAPALELAVVPAAGGREEEGGEGEGEGWEGRRRGWEKNKMKIRTQVKRESRRQRSIHVIQAFNRPQGSSWRGEGFLIKYILKTGSVSYSLASMELYRRCYMHSLTSANCHNFQL